MTDNKDLHKYDDIIDLDPPVSKKHPQMSMHNRAAQFSPFAALSGHAAAIQETARLTDRKIDLDEEKKAEINRKLSTILSLKDNPPEITLTYFKADSKKDGGEYLKISGTLKKVDSYSHEIIMSDGTHIHADDIYEVDSEFFNSME